MTRPAGETTGIDEVLGQPHVAVLCTRTRTGDPHLTAVWFMPASDSLRVVSRAGARKVRNIAGDPRVQVCINAGPVGPCVTVIGTAHILGEASLDEVRQLALRYLGEAGAAAYLSSRPPEAVSVSIEVRPHSWKYWKA